MKTIHSLLVLLAISGLLTTGCGASLAESAPSSTPTLVKERPTPTLTPTTIPATEAPTLPPPLPDTFDITLAITNLTCGSGGTVEHPYTFTIDDTSLSLLQVDADITTTGSFEPATGAFSTSAVVGPGTESYEGTITFDGTTITVVGGNSYEQTGQCTYTGSIEGTATVP